MPSQRRMNVIYFFFSPFFSIILAFILPFIVASFLFISSPFRSCLSFVLGFFLFFPFILLPFVLLFFFPFRPRVRSNMTGKASSVPFLGEIRGDRWFYATASKGRSVAGAGARERVCMSASDRGRRIERLAVAREWAGNSSARTM